MADSRHYVTRCLMTHFCWHSMGRAPQDRETPSIPKTSILSTHYNHCARHTHGKSNELRPCFWEDNLVSCERWAVLFLENEALPLATGQTLNSQSWDDLKRWTGWCAWLLVTWLSCSCLSYLCITQLLDEIDVWFEHRNMCKGKADVRMLTYFDLGDSSCPQINCRLVCWMVVARDSLPFLRGEIISGKHNIFFAHMSHCRLRWNVSWSLSTAAMSISGNTYLAVIRILSENNLISPNDLLQPYCVANMLNSMISSVIFTLKSQILSLQINFRCRTSQA